MLAKSAASLSIDTASATAWSGVAAAVLSPLSLTSPVGSVTSTAAASPPMADDLYARHMPEVVAQLAQCFPQLNAWQQELVRRYSARLHQRLAIYIHNVAEVMVYETKDEVVTPTEESALAAANAAAGSATAAMQPLVAPTLSHPTFQTCLLDTLLGILEEEWESIFAQCSTADGKRISKHERLAKGLNHGNLVYGEVGLRALGEVMWLHAEYFANLKPGATFIDLGSGTGRGVLAASYLFPFGKLIGYEILDGLDHAAQEVLHTYEQTVRPLLPADHIRASQLIELNCANFLQVDWSGADFLFANSTCYDDDLLDAIAEQAEKLKDGTVIVTLTNALTGAHFQLRYCEQHRMSWGNATVNIHIKITPTPEADAAAKAEKARLQKARRRRAPD